MMEPVSAARPIQVLFLSEETLLRLSRAKRSTLLDRKKSLPPEAAFAIRDEYITLAQLLKMAGIIGTGGEAKHYLATTPVLVNGEPEQRRGRKLRAGDLMQAPGEALILILHAATTETGSSHEAER